jgi:RimK family alpha-L-glutamate ligase
VARIAIFTEDPGWHGSQLRNAFASKGYLAEYVSLTDCKITVEPGQLPVIIPGFEQSLPDAVFVRGVPGGSLEEVVFYLDILHALKLLQIPVYNDGRAIEKSVDKAMTSLLLKQSGLPTPPTWVVRDRSQALAIAENELRNGHRLLTKPLFGSQGEGIRRIEKMTDLFWLASSHGIYYLQRFVDCGEAGYSDWRVFIINGRVIGTMRRHGVCWLNNVARGAKCEAVLVDTKMTGLAMAATKALSMDYAGVDIISDSQGNYTVIEVNSIPAWKGLQSVCHVDVAELLVADLVGRYLVNAASLDKAIS